MRILKIIAFTLTFLLVWSLWVAEAKGKKIKVYLDAPEQVAHNEEYTLYLLEQMRIADDADPSFEFEWVEPLKAEYIITIIADRNPLPVVICDECKPKITCRQYVLSLQLWRKNSGKTHEMLNQQLDCDPNEMAKRAVTALMISMGLNTENYAVQKQ